MTGTTALAALPAAGEEVLIRGMGRNLGWRVAAADGRISFEDCSGPPHDPREGQVVPTAMRCPRREAVEAAGILLDFEPLAGRLRFMDELGLEREGRRSCRARR